MAGLLIENGKPLDLNRQTQGNAMTTIKLAENIKGRTGDEFMTRFEFSLIFKSGERKQRHIVNSISHACVRS